NVDQAPPWCLIVPISLPVAVDQSTTDPGPQVARVLPSAVRAPYPPADVNRSFADRAVGSPGFLVSLSAASGGLAGSDAAGPATPAVAARGPAGSAAGAQSEKPAAARPRAPIRARRACGLQVMVISRITPVVRSRTATGIMSGAETARRNVPAAR